MKYREFRSKMLEEAIRTRTPILGEFELTAHCNFACKMCYVINKKAMDLNTEQWKAIFKKAYDNGLLFALMTGGEIFMRNDFIALYNYLYDLGVKITLFSNGSMISEEVVNALRKRPPEYIAITLYGASEKTYLAITNQKGFNDVDQAINRLKDKGINIVIRTLPLKPIYNDLDKMINWVKSIGLSLNYSQYVGPTRTLNFNHKEMRLEPKELEIFTTKINKEFGYESNSTENYSVDEKSCAALRAAYFINYEGLMMPCAMAYKPARSVLGEEPFIDVFHNLYLEMKDIEKDYECLGCKHRGTCIQCYARRLLEGNPKGCASYLKAYAIIKEGDN